MKKSTGNMYTFITHTWNPVKGDCPYNCVYCYVKKWGKKYPLRLDENVLNEKLGENNFIFICSGCDLFHPSIPDEWISKVLLQTKKYSNNQYLLHTKNPERALLWEKNLSDNYVLCVTIESDNVEWEISKAPPIMNRIRGLVRWSGRKMITVEPIMEFKSPYLFSSLILSCKPEQVNIGAATKNKNLPEPTTFKTSLLIQYLRQFTKVHLKKNLRRIYPGKGGQCDK